MTKLKLATGITILASPYWIASIKKLTIRNTNIPDNSAYRTFLRVNQKRFAVTSGTRHTAAFATSSGVPHLPATMSLVG